MYVSAGPSAATRAASTIVAAPTPISVDRQPRTTPTPRTIVSASTISTALAEKAPSRMRISLVFTRSLLGWRESAHRLRRRHEVVRAGDRPGVLRQGVAGPVVEAGHAFEHLLKRFLLRAKADEHGAVVGDRSVGHVPSEDLPKGVLVGARDVGIGGLVVQLDTVRLPAADDALLIAVGQRLPVGRVVRPLLEEQDCPAAAGLALGNEHELRCLDQRRILRAVDEPSQVEIVPVRPARGLLGDGGYLRQRADRHS